MMFTQKELYVIAHALNIKKDGTARLFTASLLPDVADFMRTLKSFSPDGQTIPEGDFEIEVKSDFQKALLEYVEEVEWTAQDAEVVLPIITKLKV